MWIADGWEDYELLDCGGGEKLERWGKQILVRPDPQAIWETPRTNRGWRSAQGRYYRSSSGGGHWDKEKLPESWTVNYKDLKFQVKPMNFKHTGLFPEQAVNWDFAREKIKNADRPIRVLNLFAYTGGATLAAAAAGASVCHVDAAKGMVAWAKENAKSSGLEAAPIRWIVDDCGKFVERELRRGRRYDAIIGEAEEKLEKARTKVEDAQAELDAATTRSSWTLPRMDAGRPARSGSWRRTCIRSWRWSRRCFPTTRCS